MAQCHQKEISFDVQLYELTISIFCVIVWSGGDSGGQYYWWVPWPAAAQAQNFHTLHVHHHVSDGNPPHNTGNHGHYTYNHSAKFIQPRSVLFITLSNLCKHYKKDRFLLVYFYIVTFCNGGRNLWSKTVGLIKSTDGWYCHHKILLLIPRLRDLCFKAITLPPS